MRYMPIPPPQSHLVPPNMAHIHPSRMYHPHPGYPHPSRMGMMPPGNMYPMPNGGAAGYHPHQQQQQQAQRMSKVEGIVLDKEMSESKSEECPEVPPELDIPRLRLSVGGDFLPIMDGEMIDETVDECGSIIQFDRDPKEENPLYL